MSVHMRPAAQVMRLERLGSFHECRLSFMRVLLRRIRDQKWVFHSPDWQVGQDGIGHAVYTVDTPERSYSLVAFAHDLPDDKRSDRVIAEAWDATFALFDGKPSQQDIDRLSKNVPVQEAGRISATEITMSRANRSARMWDHVVDRLAKGHQPDADLLDNVGYLMRTTAVYGSGKFGAIDFERICNRPEFSSAFQAEMLTVFLIRQFVFDLVEHHARMKSKRAVPLDDVVKRGLGIGNSTGLGMAPFLVNHPELLHQWIAARELAISRVRDLPTAKPADLRHFHQALDRAIENANLWVVDEPLQMKRITQLRAGLAAVKEHTQTTAFENLPTPWDKLINWTADLSIEAQEQVASLILEPYGDLVDDLASSMKVDAGKAQPIDGTRTVGDLTAIIKDSFGWVFEYDFTSKSDKARFWYVSQEKLEPRLGERFEEEGAELERPLGIARDVRDLMESLSKQPTDQSVAQFLVQHTEFRRTVRRVEIAQDHPYSEIQDNLLCAKMRPIDILRCKLSFFGATRFDPRSDRWVRICMFQNAPLVTDFAKNGMPNRGDYARGL